MRFSQLSCLFVLLGLFSIASGALMGIDFGSEFIKVAAVKPGTSFHIVVDEQTKRKIPTIVSFVDGERVFGNNAESQLTKKPARCFHLIFPLLGKSPDSPVVAEFKKNNPYYKVVDLPKRGTIALQYKNETYSPEELVGMSLQHVLKLGEVDAEGPVKDAVLTVPQYFTQKERQALLDAAAIAGLNVLSLINENTAAAVNLGVHKDFNANTSDTVILYNMGSTGTQVSAIHYGTWNKKITKRENKTIGHATVLSTASDSTLGGLAFDRILAEYLLKDACTQFKWDESDIRQQHRVLAKILKAAKKAKKVLSANKETPVFIEGLYNDRDYKGFITRKQFYELSQALLDRVVAPLEAVIEDAGLDKKEADIIIIGGSVRIPGVQARLKKFMEKEELGQSLNGDEAMAMGAVFRAANLSTTFKVRQFGLTDILTYPAGVRVTDLPTEAGATETEEAATEDEAEEKETTETEGGEAAEGDESGESKAKKVFSKRATLFKRNNHLSKSKKVAFSHETDLQILVQHDTPSLLPEGVAQPISLINVTGVADLMKNEDVQKLLETQKPRVSLTFLLDSSGAVDLTKAEATLEETIMVVKPKVVKEEKKDKKKKKKKGANATATDANATDTDANATDATEADAEAKEAPEENKPEETREAGAGDEAEPAEKETEAAEEQKEEAKPAAEEEEAAAPAADGETAEEEAAAAPAEEGEVKAEVNATDANATETNATETNATKAEDVVEYEPKVIKRRFPLTITRSGVKTTVQPLGTKGRKKAAKKLKALQKTDDLKKEALRAMNDLETYVYSTRSFLDEEGVAEVSLEEDREALRTLLTDTEDWVYDQDQSHPQVFQDKLAELRLLSDPIQLRYHERKDLPEAVNKTRYFINSTREMLANVSTVMPWLAEKDIQDLKDKLNETEVWLDAMLVNQSKLEAHEVPVLTTNGLMAKFRPVAKKSQALFRRPKPRDWDEKKLKEELAKMMNETQANATNATDANATDANATETDEAVPTGEEEASSEEKVEDGEAEAEAEAEAETEAADVGEQEDSASVEAKEATEEEQPAKDEL